MFAAGVAVLAWGLTRHPVGPSPPALHAASEPERVDAAERSSQASPTTSVPVPRDLSRVEPVLAERINAALRAVSERPEDPKGHGQLGMLYEAHGRVELALECYTNAIALDSQSPRWHHHQGVLRYLEGDLAGAESSFRKVIARDPGYAPAHERLGLLLHAQNDFDGAAAAFRRVVELRPDEAAGYVDLARVHLATGQYEAVVQASSKAVALAPVWRMPHYLLGQAYRRLGREDEAQVELRRGGGNRRSFVRDPWRAEVAAASLTSQAQVKVARRRILGGRVAEGLRLLEEQVEREPKDVARAIALASTYLWLSRPEDAKRTLERILGVRPDYYVPDYYMAAAMQALGDMKAALDYAKRATALAPKVGRAFTRLGTIYAAVDRREEALSAFRRALELDPGQAGVHPAIGRVLMGLERWEEATQPWETAVEQQPHVSSHRYKLGIVYTRLNRIDEAIATLRVAIELNPDHRRAKRALALALERKTGR